MGCRSDVGLCLQHSAYTKLCNSVETLQYTDSKTHGLIQNILHNSQRTLECAEAVVFYWNSVTWRSDYEDVRWLENLLSRLEPEDYLFLRIGKETGVMESKGRYRDNPFGMRVVREIAFD